MTTLLFFDDFYLTRWENLHRRVGRPELVPESIFVDPDHGLASAYPTVWRDETGKWRCLYNGKSIALAPKTVKFPLVIESDDGIRWEIPDLTETVPLPDRRYPNQVLPVDERFYEWCHYVDERAEDPQERLKGLAVKDGKTTLWTSPDGLAWRRVEGVDWRPGAPDAPSNAFWNELRQSYVLIARYARADPRSYDALWNEVSQIDGLVAHRRVNPTPRRYAVSETKDWRTFSEPEVAVMCDALDSPLAEAYGMPVFPYEGIYIGLLWIHHTVPYSADDPRTLGKYWQGKTDCQLTYSYNGWHFQRTLREPFMPNAPTGELGAGTMRPISMIVDDEQTIRIYSSASKVEHGYHIRGTDLGAILMHRLRLDGFVYLESAGGPGILGTGPLVWRSGEPRLNVQSGHEVRVQVTDIQGKTIEGYSFADCEPFIGDELFWEPRWKNGVRMANLGRRLLRLEISLENARIYAIRGDFLPMLEGIGIVAD